MLELIFQKVNILFLFVTDVNGLPFNGEVMKQKHKY